LTIDLPAAELRRIVCSLLENRTGSCLGHVRRTSVKTDSSLTGSGTKSSVYCGCLASKFALVCLLSGWLAPCLAAPSNNELRAEFPAPAAAQIKSQIDSLVSRNCTKGTKPEINTAVGRVSKNSAERFVFVQVGCPMGSSAERSSALILIFEGDGVLRGREFPNVLAATGGYQVEIGNLSYGATFTAEDDPRCCPTGRADVNLNVQKLEMVVKRTEPKGRDEQVLSKDIPPEKTARSR